MAAFRWIFSGMFALIPGIFFAIGLSEALEQVRKYSNAATTQGVIVAPDEGVRYEKNVTPPTPRPFDPDDPHVRFRYEVAGKTYFDEQNLFFQQADGRAPRYSLGQGVTVHYNAQKPGTAWLILDIDSMPFMMMLFVTPFWTIAAAVFFVMGSSKAASPTTPVGNGWHQLQVLSTRSDKLFSAWVVLVAASIPGTAIYLHTRIAPPWATTEMLIATSLYTLLMCGLLAHVVYRVMTLRAGREAIVLINAPTATIGQPIAVRVEHDLRRALPMATLEVGLHCRRDDKVTGGGKTQYNTDNVHDSWQLSCDVSNLAMGQPAVCEGDLELPPNAQPSRRDGDTSYPRHTWTVQVRTRLPGADYNAKFGLPVVAGAMPLPRVERELASADAEPALTPEEAHAQGLEHETHRIVDDVPDAFNTQEAYEDHSQDNVEDPDRPR